MPHLVDLTTLADLKNFISPSLSSTSGSDTTLAKTITAVSIGINRYVSRALAVGSFAEVRNGNGRPSMRALTYPVLSVASVVISPVAGSPGRTLLPSNGSQAAAVTWDKWFVYLQAAIFEEGKQNVTLNYTGGFITPGQLQVLALPAWAPAAVTLPNAQVQVAGFYYEAVNAGTTGGSAPAWFTTRNSLTSDNGILWRCLGALPVLPVNADMVPDDFQQACMQQAALLFKNRTRVGDTGTGMGPDRVNYFLKEAHPSTLALLNSHREVFPIDGMGVQ